MLDILTSCGWYGQLYWEGASSPSSRWGFYAKFKREDRSSPTCTMYIYPSRQTCVCVYTQLDLQISMFYFNLRQPGTLIKHFLARVQIQQYIPRSHFAQNFIKWFFKSTIKAALLFQLLFQPKQISKMQIDKVNTTAKKWQHCTAQ